MPLKKSYARFPWVHFPGIHVIRAGKRKCEVIGSPTSLSVTQRRQGRKGENIYEVYVRKKIYRNLCVLGALA